MRAISLNLSRLIAGLLFAGALFAVPAAAAGSAGDLCDRLAAVPFDPDKPPHVQAVNQIAPEKIKEAVSACQKAAAAPGAPRRMWLQLGRALEFEARSGEAAAAYAKAADQGGSMAMLALSALYASGRGIPQDNAKALSWLHRAADAGNAAAMNNLGAMYGLGAGVSKDAGEAKGWFEKAASAGFSESMYQLGLMAQAGDGAPKDAGAAKSWFEKAAALDHPDALYSLGLMASGARNDALAKNLMARAAALGNEDAAKALASDGKEPAPR
jgi:uncharacterized protein